MSEVDSSTSMTTVGSTSTSPSRSRLRVKVKVKVKVNVDGHVVEALSPGWRTLGRTHGARLPREPAVSGARPDAAALVLPPRGLPSRGLPRGGAPRRLRAVRALLARRDRR